MKRLGFVYCLLNFLNCYASENKLFDRYRPTNEKFREITSKLDSFERDVVFKRDNLSEDMRNKMDLEVMQLQCRAKRILKNIAIFEPELSKELDIQMHEAVKGCIFLVKKDVEKLDENFQMTRTSFEEATATE